MPVRGRVPATRQVIQLRCPCRSPSRTGTRISANYGWTDFHVLMPAHYFITQAASQDIGVNVYVRQPLPRAGMPWRMEAIAELRNLLAQGYIPIGDAAQHSVLTNAPRALRGGLNFIF